MSIHTFHLYMGGVERVNGDYYNYYIKTGDIT